MKDWNWSSYKGFNVVTKRDKVIGTHYELTLEGVIIRFFSKRDVICFLRFYKLKGCNDIRIVNLFNGIIVDVVD